MKIDFITRPLWAAFLLCSPAMATDIYVDGLYGNDSASGTSAAPLKTSAKAISLATPGDVVHLRPTITYPTVSIVGKSGSATAAITIEGDGAAPNLTKVSGGSKNFGVQVNGGASYIAVLNLDVSAAGAWSGVYVGNSSHNVLISGNTVHGSGEGGISTTHADYLTVSYNTVYANAKYTKAGIFGSGISTYENTGIDSYTGVKSIINANTVYANTNKPTAGYNGGLDPDGSGIIIDDSRHTQSDNKPYNGTTLVENNLVFNNGGRGIYSYQSSNEIITNNTTYFNNQDPYEASWQPGEIMVNGGGGNISITNNITFTDGSAGTSQTYYHTGITVEYAQDGAGSLVIDYNLLYNATGDSSTITFLGDSTHPNTDPVTFGSHNAFANPLFTAAGTNPAMVNFRPQQGSPALATGYKPLASTTDITGAARGALIDLGAYQETK